MITFSMFLPRLAYPVPSCCSWSTAPAIAFLKQPTFRIIKIKTYFTATSVQNQLWNDCFLRVFAQIGWSCPELLLTALCLQLLLQLSWNNQLFISLKLETLYCNFRSSSILEWLLSQCSSPGWLILYQAAVFCLQVGLPENKELSIWVAG